MPTPKPAEVGTAEEFAIKLSGCVRLGLLSVHDAAALIRARDAAVRAAALEEAAQTCVRVERQLTGARHETAVYGLRSAERSIRVLKDKP